MEMRSSYRGYVHANSLSNERKAWAFLKLHFEVQMKPFIESGVLTDQETLGKEKTKPFLGIQKKNAILYRTTESKILTFFCKVADTVELLCNLSSKEAAEYVEALPNDH